MVSAKKTLRYYYWIIREFAKKNARLILLSFLLSIIAIISITSLSPYLLNALTTQNQTVGLIGTPDISSVPDEVLSKISNGLVAINAKGQIIPVLADTWEQIDHGKEYRFHIRKNLYWNDGERFTARDVNYHFKDVETQVSRDDMVTFILKKPLPVFTTYLTRPIIKYPLKGVGGLYKVDHIKSQYGIIKEISLSPNKSNLPALVYRFYDSETKLINAYKLGEISEMTTNKLNVAQFFTSWKNTVVHRNVDYSKLLTLFFNMNNPILKDKETRQAIVMGIPRDGFVQQGQMANGPIPPLSWAYSETAKPIQYDPELSDKLITKGFEATKSASLTLSTYEDYLDVSDQIEQSFKDKALKIKVDVLADKPQNFDMLLAYWNVPSDPDQYYFWHSTQTVGNISNYKNVKIDKLLEDGRNTTSVDERKAIYADFQKVMNDDVPAFFLYYPYSYTIQRK